MLAAALPARSLPSALAPLGAPPAAAQSNSSLLSPYGAWFSNESNYNRSPAWADYDNDGDLDLAVGLHGDGARGAGAVKIFPNSGRTLVAERATTIGTGSGLDVTELAWGDYDNDGWLDVAVANESGPSRVYRNQNGRIRSDNPVSLAGITSALALAWGDMNGDSRLDLAVGGCYAGRVYLNSATGFSDATVDIFGRAPSGASCISTLAWGDMDGDGKLDLAVGYGENGRTFNNSATGALQVLVNNDGSSWKPAAVGIVETGGSAGGPTPPRVVDLAWGDMDGNGRLDLAVVSENWPDTDISAAPYIYLRVYRNAAGSLSAGDVEQLVSADRAFGVAWTDVDGDGDLDLAASGRPSVGVYLNQGSTVNGRTLEPEASWVSDTVTDAREIAWGDMDGDGRLDLALSQAYGNVIVFRNRTVGMQAGDPAWRSTEPETTTSVAWGDMDNDGDLDLALGNDGYDQVYRNDAGALVLSWIGTNFDNTTSVAWGDMNGDGRLDLALGNDSQPSWVYLNTGATLAATPAWSSPNMRDKTRSVAWGDVDGDGDLDLAVGSDGPSRVYLNTGTTLSAANSWSSEAADTRSVAWGDVDNDGDLDLVFGNDRQSALYRNSGGALALDLTWQQAPRDSIQAVGLADVDGDGDLDLAVASWGVSTKLYLNTNGVFASQPAWESGDSLVARSLAWGDADGDGDPDLAVSNWYGPSRVYLNENGRLQSAAEGFWSSGADSVGARSVAWGDLNGDGQLDLAIGRDKPFSTDGRTSLVYLNLRDRTTRLPTTLRNDPPQINVRQPGRTPAANLYASPEIFSTGVISIPFTLKDPESRLSGPVRAQFSLDGGHSWQTAVPVAPLTGLATSPAGTTHTFLWDVYKSRFFGQSDNLVVRLTVLPGYKGSPNGVAGSFPFAFNSGATFPFRARGTQVRVVGPGGAARPGAEVFSLPRQGTGAATRIGDSQSNAYRTSAEGYLPGRGTITPGDQLVALWPVTRQGTQITQTVTMSQTRSANVAIPDAGVLSDTLRINAGGTIRRVSVVNLKGTHTWVGDLRFSLVSPAGTRVQLLANQCGSEDNFDLGLADDGVQILPCPPTNTRNYRPITPLSVFNGESAQGLWTLVVEDTAAQDMGTLGTWGLQITVDRVGPSPDQVPYDNRVSYFYTSAPVTVTGSLPSASAPLTTTGILPYVARATGVQTLTVSPGNPLILFNLNVSLEWDARGDQAYMQQLRRDMMRASELLYDWTDGQAALGKVTIYQDKQLWDNDLGPGGEVVEQAADIQIFATNRLRPNASRGGIVSQPYTETLTVGGTSTSLAYNPGSVRMGATWNRYGEPGVSLGEDWPRTLAHELGHYALFLDDNYFGLDDNGGLINISSCRGAMADPYREDWSELHPRDGRWTEDCARTLSQRVTGRSDWETVQRFYSFTARQDSSAFAPVSPARFNANPGPTGLPLAVTQIVEAPAPASDGLISAPYYTLVTTDGVRYIPDTTARAILYRAGGSRATDLGTAMGNQVFARGARSGDRLCVYDQKQGYAGCAVLSPTTAELTLGQRPGWDPDLRIIPSDGRIVRLEVPAATAFRTNTPATYPPALNARIFPEEGPGMTVTLGLAGTGVQTYTGEISFPETALGALVEVSVPGDPSYGAAVSEYRLGGSPGRQQRRGSGRGGSRAPTLSADGQVILYAENIAINQGDFFAFQTATVLPGAPPWAIPVGRGYHLLASANLKARVANQPIAISYFSNDVVSGTESGLQMFFQPAGGGAWQPLESTHTPDEWMVTARTRGEGLYVLMSTLPVVRGWNLIGFPWPEREMSVARAMAFVNGERGVGTNLSRSYTTIYGFDPNDPNDPWKVYDSAMDPGLSDLTTVRYGYGYWLLATEGSTADAITASPIATRPMPPVRPASYYATLAARPGYTPAAGQEVRALIDGVVCETTTTRAVDGQIVFLIDVPTDAEVAGCGVTGRTVTFEVAGQPFAEAAWKNHRPQRLLSGQPTATATPSATATSTTPTTTATATATPTATGTATTPTGSPSTTSTPTATGTATTPTTSPTTPTSSPTVTPPGDERIFLPQL